MHDDVECPVGDNPIDRRRVAQVRSVQCHFPVPARRGDIFALDFRRIEIVEIVEHGDPMAVA